MRRRREGRRTQQDEAATGEGEPHAALRAELLPHNDHDTPANVVESPSRQRLIATRYRTAITPSLGAADSYNQNPERLNVCSVKVK
jgi:hypothetical protein